ncbi:hypothetical protein ACFPTO_13965 [Paraburkholderia denitrificans]|uniref:Uncharacterized protein n=1 Tax=Paraburkholderia denitrificans TaxID=694025 RepID=A0ABW0J9Z8_9BURK
MLDPLKPLKLPAANSGSRQETSRAARLRAQPCLSARFTAQYSPGFLLDVIASNVTPDPDVCNQPASLGIIPARSNSASFHCSFARSLGGGGACGKRSLEGMFLPGCVMTAKAAARDITGKS